MIGSTSGGPQDVHELEDDTGSSFELVEETASASELPSSSDDDDYNAWVAAEEKSAAVAAAAAYKGEHDYRKHSHTNFLCEQ